MAWDLRVHNHEARHLAALHGGLDQAHGRPSYVKLLLMLQKTVNAGKDVSPYGTPALCAPSLNFCTWTMLGSRQRCMMATSVPKMCSSCLLSEARSIFTATGVVPLRTPR